MATQGLWTGLERATGNIAATGMNLLQFQAQQKLRRGLLEESGIRLGLEKERLDIERQTAEQRTKVFKYAEEERERIKTELDAFIPLSVAARNIQGLSNSKNLLIQTLKNAGHEIRETPDGETYVTNRGMAYYKNLLNTNTEVLKATIDSQFTDLQAQSVAIGQQIAQLQEASKGDEKTLAPLLRKQVIIKMQIGGIVGAQRDVQAEILKQQVKPVTPQDRYEDMGYGQVWDKVEGKIVKVPVAPTAAEKPTKERVPTTADINQVGEMVTTLNETDEPNPNDIELTKLAADKIGYKLEKLTGKTATYGLPFKGKPLWGGKEISKWQLVPKDSVQPPAGYKLDPKGRTVKGKPAYISPDGKRVWTQ